MTKEQLQELAEEHSASIALCDTIFSLEEKLVEFGQEVLDSQWREDDPPYEEEILCKIDGRGAVRYAICKRWHSDGRVHKLSGGSFYQTHWRALD